MHTVRGYMYIQGASTIEEKTGRKHEMAEAATPERVAKKRRRGDAHSINDNWQDEGYSSPSLRVHTSPTNPNNLQPRTLDQLKKTWVSRHRQGCDLNTAQRERQFDYLEVNELFVDRS